MRAGHILCGRQVLCILGNKLVYILALQTTLKKHFPNLVRHKFKTACWAIHSWCYTRSYYVCAAGLISYHAMRACFVLYAQQVQVSMLVFWYVRACAHVLLYMRSCRLLYLCAISNRCSHALLCMRSLSFVCVHKFWCMCAQQVLCMYAQVAALFNMYSRGRVETKSRASWFLK